jgi:hypothetical protein
MANHFNARLNRHLEVTNDYIQQNNGRKKLTPAAVQLLADTLAPNYDVEIENGTFTLKQQGEVVGRIKQREVHRAINNVGEPGQPRPRLRYHDVLDVIIEVANENYLNIIEDAIRQALNMGPRLNFADFPLEGSPAPGANNMNIEGGRKRKRTKSKSKRRNSKKYRQTRRRA